MAAASNKLQFRARLEKTTKSCYVFKVVDNEAVRSIYGTVYLPKDAFPNGFDVNAEITLSADPKSVSA